MPYANDVLTKERDLKVLYFIWLWKLATTSAIANQYFKDRSSTMAYQRLRSLERGGFIECIQDGKTGRAFWLLKRKGFELLDDLLPALSAEGFRTERIHHDSIVAAIHLGEWMAGLPAGSSLFTEQQLRCFHKDYYPSWVPRSLDRRPDGFWRVPSEIPGEHLTIALEVELHRQPSTYYENIGHLYAMSSQVHRVLWVIKEISLERRLRQILQRMSAERPDLHHFVSLKDVLKNGWEAAIMSGEERGKTISKFLSRQPGYNRDAIGTPVVPRWTCHPFLDGRKKADLTRRCGPGPLADATAKAACA